MFPTQYDFPPAHLMGWTGRRLSMAHYATDCHYFGPSVSQARLILPLQFDMLQTLAFVQRGSIPSFLQGLRRCLMEKSSASIFVLWSSQSGPSGGISGELFVTSMGTPTGACSHGSWQRVSSYSKLNTFGFGVSFPSPACAVRSDGAQS